MKKIAAFFLLAAVLVLTVTGCSLFEPEEKTFTKNGLTITLTDEFVESQNVTYMAYYASTDIVVAVIKESKSLFAETEYANITLRDYAELVKSANELDTTIEEKDGLICFAFDMEQNGNSLRWLGTVYEGEDAWWFIQFGCLAEEYSDLESDILKYAKSVKV